MGKNRALITGITGQDGSYLAEFLLAQGYEVFGLARRSDLDDDLHRLYRLQNVRKDIRLLTGNIESLACVRSAVREAMPDEIYHLAAQSFVNVSTDEEPETLHTNIGGIQAILTVCKELAPKARIFFASSSEIFGDAPESPQNEQTQFIPRSVYGISKLAGLHLVRRAREHQGLHASSGIFYNHESPRRGPEFVTRRITLAAARIRLGLSDRITLGNLEAKRDWGHARDYVKAMWLMLQRSIPSDFVISSGQARSIREFLELAFRRLNLNYQDYLEIDPKLFRPTEKVTLCGDASRAQRELGWSPSTSFENLVAEMVDHDFQLLTQAYPHLSNGLGKVLDSRERFLSKTRTL